MGVKQLWPVLEDVHTTVGPSDLRGLTLAVDFLGWIYQSERAGALQDKQGIKPHIRNLFWRVHTLLRHRVKPVFVLDGPSPKLKQSTLDKRLVETQKFYQRQGVADGSSPSKRYASSAEADIPDTDSSEASTSSGRIGTPGGKIKECCELLDCLGVPYITSPGEAEATCALLNKEGIVDGCITEDCDVFLFGAKTVYRNFNTSAKSSADIQCYTMSDIETKLSLCREKLVALALMVGCDYDQGGVKGVGKEQAVRLLQSWPEGDYALQRLQDWKDDSCGLDTQQPIKKPNHCSNCDHPGSCSMHTSNGCGVCKQDMGCLNQKDPGVTQIVCMCDWHQLNRESKGKALETRLRKKALENADFPDKEIIKAFMDDQKLDPEWTARLQWRRPNFERLTKFCTNNLGWNKLKAVSRILPLITVWDMQEVVLNKAEPRSTPDKILHSRTCKKVKVFDVQWKHIADVPDDILELPGDDTDSEHQEGGVTVETRSDMEEAFPWLVKFFDNERAPAKGKKLQSKKREPPSDSTQLKQPRIDKMFKVRKKLDFSPSTSNGTNTSALGSDRTPKRESLPGVTAKMSKRRKADKTVCRVPLDTDVAEAIVVPD